MADVSISQLNSGTPNSSAVIPYSDGSITLKATVGQIGVPIGTIVMWNNRGGASIPTNWALCDGTNGTPDLRDKFIVGSGNAYAIGNVGGSSTASGSTNSTTLTIDQIPSHNHGGSTSAPNGSWGNGGIWTEYTAPAGGNRCIAYNGTAYANASNNLSDHGHTIYAQGGGQGHNHTISSINTLPPYYALAYIQKIA